MRGGENYVVNGQFTPLDHSSTVESSHVRQCELSLRESSARNVIENSCLVHTADPTQLDRRAL